MLASTQYLKCIFFPLGRACIKNLFEEGKVTFIVEYSSLRVTGGEVYVEK